MIGLKVLLAGTDYTAYLSSLNIKWPANTALPTCAVILDNAHGDFSTLPLYSTMALTLPNSVGTFNFRSESAPYSFTTTQGHFVQIDGLAGPQLQFLNEGNLDVVGTDLSVYEFGHRPGSGSVIQYAPYPSRYIASLSTNLLDIGDALTTLLGDGLGAGLQPNQAAGYRGRLGYDATGRGVPDATGIAFTQGVSTSWFSPGLYVKGMWQVGLGSTGAQKSGLETVRDLVGKSVIDSTGTPRWVDFFVDNTQTPSLLTVDVRAHTGSGQSFAVGTDPILENTLPVSIDDVRNFIILWGNDEIQYPNGGDSWSNYDTRPDMEHQWTWAANLTNAIDNVSTDTPTGLGTSMEFDATVNNADGSVLGAFDIQANGYVRLVPARRLSAFSFYLKRLVNGPADEFTANLYDTNGHSATHTDTFVSVNAWEFHKILIPSGFVQNAGFDFTTSTIAKVEFNFLMGHNNVINQVFNLDYIQFADDWDFFPFYTGATIPGLTPSTDDPNSIAAYGDRTFNFVDYYVTNGASDAAQNIAAAILQSRKGKTSGGKIKVDGYAPQVRSIKPTRAFTITDSRDVYTGGAIDSVISSWIPEEVEYNIDKGSGFTATYTVEPHYATFAGSSPDTNFLNPWAKFNRTDAGVIQRFRRMTQQGGINSTK